MLSLIICSRHSRISEELEKNIAETIGCEYELVVIDNSKNDYSIFSAYKEGVRRSKGDIFCFMHDDILYRTVNWGKRIEKMLEREDIGCVGVAGGHYISESSFWWDSPIQSMYVMDMRGMHDERLFADGKDEVEVAVVDGLWMCIPAKAFDCVRWDVTTYNGWHSYDSDICMQLLDCGKKNFVILDILIEHKHISHNDIYNQGMTINSNLFVKKWSHILPVLKGVKSTPQIEELVRCAYKNHSQFIKYQNLYYSIANSRAFKLGNFLLLPIYKIKQLLKYVKKHDES